MNLTEQLGTLISSNSSQQLELEIRKRNGSEVFRSRVFVFLTRRKPIGRFCFWRRLPVSVPKLTLDTYLVELVQTSLLPSPTNGVPWVSPWFEHYATAPGGVTWQSGCHESSIRTREYRGCAVMIVCMSFFSFVSIESPLSEPPSPSLLQLLDSPQISLVGLPYLDNDTLRRMPEGPPIDRAGSAR